MATSTLHLRHLCTAAAVHDDLLAVSTPEHKVAVYTRSGKLLETLDAHIATVSGLQFVGGTSGGSDSSGIEGGSAAASRVRLISCSHDRNSYVWTRHKQEQQTQGQRQAAASERTTAVSSSTASTQQQQQQQQQQQWKPELVITRLRLAGLCLAAAPSGLKFAIGSSEKTVVVVYWDAGKALWAPKLIKKRHEGSVMAAAWHPSGTLLATACTDGWLRLFNAVVQDIDGKQSVPALGGTRFGDCLLQLPLPDNSWGLAAAFSPTGDSLAVASQAMQLTLLSGLDLQSAASLDAEAVAARVQHVQLPGLPLKCLAFLADGVLAGGGFDNAAQLFARQDDGRWRHSRTLQGKAPSSHSSDNSTGAIQPKAASLSARIRMFEQQAAAAAAAHPGGRAAAGGSSTTTGSEQQGQEQQGGPHNNCIVSIMPLPLASGGHLAFITASLEGCIAEWQVDPASL